MNKPTSLDKEFNELNTFHLSPSKKTEMLQNIKSRTKKRKMLDNVKYAIIVSAAIALLSVLSINMISNNFQKEHSAEQPKTTVKTKPAPQPSQIVNKSDSSSWEAASRLRYDLGTIEKMETKQNQIEITIKRIDSFGSDTDPIDTIKPDTDTRTYILRTSADKQILHLKVNQQVLLLNGQYLQKNSSEAFWAAEVIGAAAQDGKLYSPNGQPLNLNISSKANVTNGTISIE